MTRGSDPKLGTTICRDIVLAGSIPIVNGFELIQARDQDKQLRKEARRLGHSVPVVGFAGHVAAPALPQVRQRPRKRLRQKISPQEADLIWTREAKSARKQIG